VHKSRASFDEADVLPDKIRLIWDWLAPMALDISSWVMQNFLIRRAANAMAASGTGAGICAKMH